MNRRTPEEARRIAESLGPAEKLVQLIILRNETLA